MYMYIRGDGQRDRYADNRQIESVKTNRWTNNWQLAISSFFLDSFSDQTEIEPLSDIYQKTALFIHLDTEVTELSEVPIYGVMFLRGNPDTSMAFLRLRRISMVSTYLRYLFTALYLYTNVHKSSAKFELPFRDNMCIWIVLVCSIL
jgi:hypothetical protein